MSTSRFALFVDLENCGAKADTLNSILEKVKMRGDILLGKVYGYTDSFSDLKEILLSNTFTVVPSIRYGYSQKNNADIQLVIDALEVAFTNQLIDSFCIVSGDSDYTPLVGRLKSMGKFVLGMSRSEVASTVFIHACNEFQFLESVHAASRSARSKKGQNKDEPLDEAGLNKLLEGILTERDEDEIYASELKGILLRLQPEFNEKSYGGGGFGKLLKRLEMKYGVLKVRIENNNVFVSLSTDVGSEKNAPRLTAENWKKQFAEQLKRYKDDGFERVNPSILKADILSQYPDFTEKSIGFKRFSDMLKELEKDGILRLELDGQKNMLIRML